MCVFVPVLLLIYAHKTVFGVCAVNQAEELIQIKKNNSKNK